MSTSSDSIDPLADADTVALVVHGVGDHTPTDILKELEQGFQSIGDGRLQGERVRMAGVPRPDGPNGEFEAFRIKDGERRHLILPVVWSRFRPRAADKADASSPTRPMESVSLALPHLLGIGIDAVRCVPKAKGIGWKAGVAALALLIFTAVAGSVAGVFYAVVHFPFWFGTAGTSDKPWYGPLVLVLAAAMLVWLVKRIIRALDLVGDVAYYIGRPSRRAELEDRVRTIIRAVASRAPHAQILLAAHSLGSVLVSHSLLNYPSAGEAPGRFVLLTFGSPLRLMASAFPRHVVEPATLLGHYTRSGNVKFWMNQWRDRDWIGRALFDGPSPRRAEQAVGDGPHRNYWRDPRVWRNVVSLVTASADNLQQISANDWRAGTLSESELREAHVRAGFLRLMGNVMAPLGLFVAVYSAMQSPDSPWFAHTPAPYRVPVRALWLAALASTLLMAICAFMGIASGGLTARERLAAVRRWGGLCVVSVWVVVLFSSALALLLWSAARY